jgi:pyridoxine/pyridoxamine 5'-phosphate oxidase
LKKQSFKITEDEREKMIDTINQKVAQGESPEFDPSIFGGYIIIPYKFEFWQGKEFRIHDRQVFYLTGGVKDLEKMLENVDYENIESFPDYSSFDWKWMMVDS